MDFIAFARLSITCLDVYVFLPARSGLGALNRYFGLKYDGSYKVRGIGIRRSDSPSLVIRAQEDILRLLEELEPGVNDHSIYTRYIELKDRYVRNIDRFPKSDFSLTLRPSKYYEDYMVENIQKASMESLMEDGIEIMPGQSMNVIINDSVKKVVNFDDQPVDRKFYTRILLRTLSLSSKSLLILLLYLYISLLLSSMSSDEGMNPFKTLEIIHKEFHGIHFVGEFHTIYFSMFPSVRGCYETRKVTNGTPSYICQVAVPLHF